MRVTAFLLVMTLSWAAYADEVKPIADTSADDAELYKCRPKSAEVAMTFKPEMELKELVAWAIALTCKPFMLDPKIIVTGRKVTLVAPQKMSREEAYRMFLAALSTIGLTVVPKETGYRIVDAPAARMQALPIYAKAPPDNTDQVVRFVMRPNFTKPEALAKGLGFLKSEAGDIQVVGSLVLVTDWGSSVRQMVTLAKLIDVPEGTDAIYTLPIKHADATKLADKLNTILGLTTSPSAKPDPNAPTAGPAVPSKLLVDERTNTLVMAASEAAFQRVAALVERLDVSLDVEGGASIHVYHLKAAVAKTLALVLNQAIGPASAPKTAAAAGTATGAPGGTADAPRLDGEARVIADDPSNSLIIMSSGRDFFAIREIIRELDQPRRQVYLEGVIVSLDLSDDLETGISAHGLIPGTGSSVLVGGLQSGSGGVSSLDVKSLASATGAVAGVMSSETITLLGQTIPSYGALFTALSTKTSSNVLQMPGVVALDNEQTHFSIGQNIPYKKGLSYGGLAGTTPAGSTTVSIDRIDLNLKLDIKPHISDDDTVMLEIDHDTKELADAGGDLGPTWANREMKTNVVVHDQQTVVLGGLITEKEYVTKTGLPFLSDIPVFGALFRHTLHQKRKAKVVVLITPYILHDRLDVEAIASRMQQKNQEFLASFKALDGMTYHPRIDYRLKRGLVEEINRAVESVEEDTATLESLHRAPGVKAGPVDLKGTDPP